MTQFIILIPAIIAAFISFTRSPERAFLMVYIPALLLLPQVYKIEIKGFPDMGFALWTITTITLFSFRKIFRGWEFTFTDVFIVGYIGCSTYSEYISSDFSAGRGLFAIMLGETMLPYLFAKTLVHKQGLSTALTKQICFVMFITCVLAFWEVRFQGNPYIMTIGKFFPGQDVDWPLIFRYGFVRVRGPMIQPILFGTIVGSALILCIWLIKSHLWENKFRYLGVLIPDIWIFKKQNIIFIFLLAVLVLTFSRGPLIATFLAWVVMGVGFAKSRWRSFFVRSSLIVIIGIFGIYKFYEYSEIDPSLAQSNQESTAAYRVKLLKKYLVVADKRPTWGHGKLNLPLLLNLKSIDNQYLWLLLKHGYPALGFFLAAIFWTMTRLFLKGMFLPKKDYLNASFYFTILGTLVTMTVSLMSVYMGMQTRPLFFLLLGWAEALILASPNTFKKDPLIQQKRPDLLEMIT